jgi:hypothetical protein
MEPQVFLLILGVVGALAGLAVAAWRWGFDSRDGFLSRARTA